MSRSSARDPSTSSGNEREAAVPRPREESRPAAGFGQAERGYAELVGALVAVAAVCAAVSLHAGLLADAVPAADRDVATPTLERVHDRLAANGSTAPDRLGNATLDGPVGYRVNVTLQASDRRWHRGPLTPSGRRLQEASRPVAVRVGAGTRTPGTLRVVVWE